ncbi:hypothetical protein B0813_002974 [Candidatus Fervidibacteria bacterium JGI MDM2 SSWTFF-3-K9]
MQQFPLRFRLIVSLPAPEGMQILLQVKTLRGKL